MNFSKLNITIDIFACYATLCLMNFLKSKIVFDILCMLWYFMFMNFSKLKIVFIDLHMNCLLGFRKMTFTIHLIFASLAGKYSDHGSLPSAHVICFVIIFLEKNYFFHVKHMVLQLMFDDFFFKKFFSRIHCNFLFISLACYM